MHTLSLEISWINAETGTSRQDIARWKNLFRAIMYISAIWYASLRRENSLRTLFAIAPLFIEVVCLAFDMPGCSLIIQAAMFGAA